MRNIRKAYWIIGSTERTEAKCNHVHIGATEPEGGIPVELHNPSRLDGADSIEEEPDICKVDLDELPFLPDIKANNKGCVQRNAIFGLRIIVTL